MSEFDFKALPREIESEPAATPTIWWLGHAGFALKFQKSTLYVDPMLSGDDAPFRGEDITSAGLVLATHADPEHLDPLTVRAILAASPRSKLLIPKSVAAHAHAMGIGYNRMVTTDSDLRVEFLDDRIYAVPSAHPQLDWTPLGGFPYLGYLIRFGGCTIYHAGDCVPYEGLAARLRPYNVTVALLPIAGRPCNFEISEAAQLAEEIGAQWLVPMHYTDDASRFIAHLLGHRPAQKFKIFERGEKWIVPA